MTRVPRSRGGFSGFLLILLGAWGGLAPLIGPYFNFGYTPDRAWAYSSGRLWLSIVPGAAALLGGLIAAITANRAGGIFGAFLAVLGGAWFVVGIPVLALADTSGTITPGSPIGGTLGSLNAADKQIIEPLALFTGLGVLILYFAATALGRFSVVGVRDAELAQAEELEAGEEAGVMEPDASYPTITGQFPAADSPFPRSPGPLRGPGS